MSHEYFDNVFNLQGVNITKGILRTPSRAFAAVFPSGDYKVIAYGYDENGESLGNITTLGSVVSSEKNTFG